MAIKFQAPKSQYNKDDVFAKLTIDTAMEATISEAVAIDVDDDKFIIFAYIDSMANVEAFGDKDFSYTAQLCKFEIPKRDYKGYGDKDVIQHPLASAIHFAIANDIGFNKPFKVEVTGANSKLQTAIIEKAWKGKDLSNDDILELIKNQAFEYEKIDSLDKLKDVKLEAPKGFQKGGGMNPKKTLEARLEFVEDCVKPDSKFRSVAVSLGYSEDDQKATLMAMLDSLMH